MVESLSLEKRILRAMPINDKDDNRDYQRLWARELLAHESPEEREARLARRRANRLKRKSAGLDVMYGQSDRRRRLSSDIDEIIEHFEYVWYAPSSDELSVRTVNEALACDSPVIIMVGKMD